MSELLERLFNKYQQLLASLDEESIKKVLEFLADRRKNINSGINISILEQAESFEADTQKILRLMEQYKSEIKQIFIDEGKNITHITDVSPENMSKRKISKSINRANNYETERGNWVFASSSPIDGTNPYVARSPKKGMIRIAKNAYIYGGNNMQIQRDDQGNNYVVLKQPNYVYEISPQNFTPVVTLKVDGTGRPYFEFSGEWISEQEVEINDSEQVKDIKMISDITDVVRNYQVLCDVNMIGEAIKIRACGNTTNAMKLLRESIKSGNLRYINGEAGINVNKMIGDSEREKCINESKENEERD